MSNSAVQGDYNSLLRKGWNEIPEEQLLPVGTWLLRCRGAALKLSTKEGGTPRFVFTYEPVEPMEDVDRESLEQLGPNYDIRQNRIFFSIWLEHGGDYDRLRKHILKHGAELGSGPEDPQISKNLRNTKVLAYLTQGTRPDASGTIVPENKALSFMEAN